MFRPDRDALVATVCAVLLCAAQLVVLNHDLADEGHAPDTVCEFCIAGAGLAGANVASVKVVVPLTVSVRVPDSGIDRATPDSFPKSHPARAPPTAS